VHEVERVPLGQHALDLAEELLRAGETRARDGLVGADDQALEAGRGIQRLQHGMAAIVVQFGLAMMPFGGFTVAWG
jgi:hypothetical protein